MAQYFKQVRFYNTEATEYNSPSNINGTELMEQLKTGEVFPYPLLQLGIQAPPGTQFNVNGSERPVIMGYTGLFELDLQESGQIIALTFENDSLEAINENPNFSLIVDMIYER